MEDKIINTLIEWAESWRNRNEIIDGKILSGETLEKFISELQNEITKVVGDFGINSSGENAKLVLYSGSDYKLVREFCETSNGEYYMISHTDANLLWDDGLRYQISATIGEYDIKGTITAQVLEGKAYEADGKTWTRTSNYATDSGNYLALDDFLSSKVTEAGLEKGNVLYMLGDAAKPNSVGLLTEMPVLFNAVAQEVLLYQIH